MASAKEFVKGNLVLIVGLTLPVLLMVGFMVAASLPQTIADPPRYDLVFAVPDYPQGAQNLPVNVRLVVKDGVLRAQYTRVAPPNAYPGGWKKLYLFEASTRRVRELPFGFPADVDTIETMREEVVEPTAQLKLDTTLQSPDGYELGYGRYSGGGLLTDVFWRPSYSNEPRLRKGGSSVPLTRGDGRPQFYYGNVEFVGWVVGPTAAVR